MFDEFLRDLDGIEQGLSRPEWLPERPATAPARPVQLGPPKPAEGTDGTGTVHVTIDADGMPEAIWVDSTWRRVVGAAGFDAAVMAAYAEATRAQLTARFAEPGSEAEPAVEQRIEDEKGARPTSGPARSLAQVLEELAAATTATRSPFGIARGIGFAELGRMVIMLSEGGLESCTGDMLWMSGHPDETLTDGLRIALAAARAELTTAKQASEHAAGLFDEAMSLTGDQKGRSRE